MCPHTLEVIRVGASDARILRVTQARIDYIDMRGRRQSIDLEECAKNWMRWYGDHIQEFILIPGSSESDSDSWKARCVGERGALDHPPWVQFMNERNSRFEFRNYEALYGELLVPLMQKGWHTFDTD